MLGLRPLWQRLRGSLWFVPTLLVAGAAGLAMALVELHTLLPLDLAQSAPRLFGTSADGARGMLGAIATSVITVAGVVFSITIVALSLASTQFSPRVLRHFMNDRPTQTVLGVMVGVYVYCLMVLRTVRTGDEGPSFVPSLAVFGALLLALLSVAMLIFFIHHVAESIQASSIIDRIADQTLEAIERLFPEPIGEPAAPEAQIAAQLPREWTEVPSPAMGYVVDVDAQELLAFATEHDRIVEFVPRIGEFVVAGAPLARVAGPAVLPQQAVQRLQRIVSLDNQRSVDQDAPYGVQQLVDIALKGLSPGINDPTTASACIDRLTAVLMRLAGRRLPGPYRQSDGVLRVIAAGPSFESIAVLAFDAITAQAGNNRDALTLERLIAALARVAGVAQEPVRREVLQQRLAVIDETITHCIELPSRQAALRERSARAAHDAR